MKIRYGFLLPIVVAALTPGSIWAQTGGGAMDESVQQSALSHGTSEQQGPNSPLGRSDDAGAVPGQSFAVAPSRKSAKTVLASVPVKRPSQYANSPLAHGPQGVKHSAVSKAPALPVPPHSTKARADGPAIAPNGNATGAFFSAQNVRSMPTHPASGSATATARGPLESAAPHPGPSGPGASVSSAPANAVARHSPVSATVGGAPAPYEPPRNAILAVIGGTMMKRNKF